MRPSPPAATWCWSATHPRAQDTTLEGLERRPVAPTLARRLERMRGRASTAAALQASAAYLAATENLARVRKE